MKSVRTLRANVAPIEQEHPHFNRRALSRRWACSGEKLKRMEKAGLLPHLKIGRAVLYRHADIMRIEQEAEVTR